MNLLINTAFLKTIVIIFDHQKIHSKKVWQTSDHLVDIISELQKTNLSSLKKIYICTGPGRFTSLRIGLAYAQTLAFIQKIPLYTFSSLEYLQAINQTNDKTVFIQQVGISDIFLNGKLTKFNNLKNQKTFWIGDILQEHLLPEKWQPKKNKNITIQKLQKLIKNKKPVQNVTLEYGKSPRVN